MFKPVTQFKIVKSGILFGGLRLFQTDEWRQTKKASEITQLAQQLLHTMQVHLQTDKLVVGLPMAGHEVILMEVQTVATDITHYHEVERFLEDHEGFYVDITPIK